MNILGLNRGAFEMSPQKENGDFLENSCDDFDYICVVYGDHIPK
jgi:hypothetical protein